MLSNLVLRTYGYQYRMSTYAALPESLLQAGPLSIVEIRYIVQSKLTQKNISITLENMLYYCLDYALVLHPQLTAHKCSVVDRYATSIINTLGIYA